MVLVQLVDANNTVHGAVSGVEASAAGDTFTMTGKAIAALAKRVRDGFSLRITEFTGEGERKARWRSTAVSLEGDTVTATAAKE